MKRWMKMTACVLAVSMMMCGCQSGTTAESSAETETAVETTVDETAAEGTSETTAAEGESEGTTVNMSTGLDDNGDLVDINTADYLTLPEYQKLVLKKTDVEVSDEELQSSIDEILESYAETKQVTDREIKDGDSVNIDYVGSVDGVEFEGGNTNGAGTDVTAGSSAYIDDFLTQIIGHKAGETFDVVVTFPDPYSANEELSGKEAVFVTTINYINETVTPELNDEFVESNFGESNDLKTVDEMKAKLNENLRLSKEKTATWAWLEENVVFDQDPTELKELLINEYVNAVKYQAESYGMTLEDLISTNGMSSEDDLRAYYESSAMELAKQYMVIQAICEAENMSVQESDLDTFFEGADYSSYVETYGNGYIKMQVKFKLVSDKLMEYATLE